LTEGQIGVPVKGEEDAMAMLRAIFTKHNALEIHEETGYETS
jgi:hypothetical protein